VKEEKESVAPCGRKTAPLLTEIGFLQDKKKRNNVEREGGRGERSYQRSGGKKARGAGTVFRWGASAKKKRASRAFSGIGDNGQKGWRKNCATKTCPPFLTIPSGPRRKKKEYWFGILLAQGEKEGKLSSGKR